MSHSKKKIYLAGPITGWSYNSARHGWRKTFADILAERAPHLECFSPMREKEFLEKEQCIGGAADYESMHGFGTPQGILTRDYNDVRTCDAMVACFIGATVPSIGTCVEFGFAKSHEKPVIMIMEPKTEKVVSTQTVVEYFDDFKSQDEICAELKRKYENYKIVARHPRSAQGDHEYTVEIPGKTETIKNPHDHVFLRACAGYVVPTLEHAADIAQSLLTPGL